MSELFAVTVNSVKDLDAFVQRLEAYFTARTIVLLEGDVGTGKTETVRALARRRGWRHVASPSFAIHLHYENASGDAADHIDFYRLESEEDLESTGFWDLFSQPTGLILLEWADRLNSDYLPLDWQRIRVRFKKQADEQSRSLVVEKIEP